MGLLQLPYPLGQQSPQQVLGSDLQITGKGYPALLLTPNSSEVAGLQISIREINGAVWIMTNADLTGNGFQQLNPAAPSSALVQYNSGMVFTYTAAAGSATPLQWFGAAIAPADAQGAFIEEFVMNGDGNPALDTFDWGPVQTRACTVLGSNSVVLYRDKFYLFVTSATMSGAGISIVGANQGATFLTAAGNNDIIGFSPTWTNSWVREATFQGRQDGTSPTAGAALNLSQASGIHVNDCRFVSTWWGVFAQGVQDLHLHDCEAVNFKNIGYLFAQATGQGKILQLRNCGANPGTVAGGATLDATGYVIDGNIASISFSGFGGTGNASDSVSYGDMIRIQNSFGGGAANLVHLFEGNADHWPNYAFNLSNWSGPPTAIGVSPGNGAGQIAKVTAGNLVATSSATGIFFDNLGGFQAVNLDMSSNGRSFGYGANASDIVLTGTKTDIAGSVGHGIEPGFQGLMLSASQVGKLGTTASGVAIKFDQPVSPTAMSNDNIFIHDCPLHATTPVGVGSATHFADFLGPNTEILDCDGYNPLLGGWPAGTIDPTAAGFPNTGVDVVNQNPFPVIISGTLNAAFSYTITPQGIGPQDGAYSSPTLAAGNFSFRVPTWGKFHYTYAATPTRLHTAAGY